MKTPHWSRRQFNRAALAAGAAAISPGLLGATGILHHKKDKQPTQPAPAPPNITGPNSLRAHAAARGLLYGAAIDPAFLDVDGMAGTGATDAYTLAVGAQCGILVAENAMKWAALRPTADTFDFAPADKLMRFADLMGQRVRGHNLCWHEALPSWFKDTATKDNARQILTSHIQSVAGHFQGRLHSWDVLNEAVEPNDGRPDGLRKSPWLDLIGPDYIELAFQTAAAVDPSARLVYNDYDIELDTPEQIVKRGQVMLLLRRLKARGIPIHAVGVQSHLKTTGPQPGEGLKEFIRSAAKLGLEVYITELDINTSKLEGGPDIQDATVAKIYEDYLSLVLVEPNVPLALTWGLTDAHTWLNQTRKPWAMRPDGSSQRPLPLDDEMKPAPAFFAVRRAIDRAHISQSRLVAPALNSAPTANPTSDPNSDPGNLYKPFPVQGSPTSQPQPSGPGE